MCRLEAILDLYVISYFYRQNNLTNEFLDLKLVEKEVLDEIFGQIVQYRPTFFYYVVWRPFWIMFVAQLCPDGQISTLVIFIGDWSLHVKLLRNFGYIKMYTGLWSRDRIIMLNLSTLSCSSSPTWTTEPRITRKKCAYTFCNVLPSLSGMLIFLFDIWILITMYVLFNVWLSE